MKIIDFKELKDVVGGERKSRSSRKRTGRKPRSKNPRN
tara:strand:+ start:2802 stop:2915 length:114 start_codon:yes stop_codon:yes gene_type:complete